MGSGGCNPPVSPLFLPAGTAPPIRIESSSPSVTEGQTLDLDCLVAGSGPATVMWYKRGGSLPAGHQVGHRQHRQRGQHPKSCPVPSYVTPMRVLNPRFRGPGSVSPMSRRPIQGSTCAGQAWGPPCVRRLSLSPSWLDPAHPTVRPGSVAPGGTCWSQTGGHGSILPPGPPASGVPVRIEASSSTVAEGQSLDLNCVVAGQGQATVTWYKRGGSLPAKHQVGDTRGGCHQGGWLGVDPQPHVSLSGPMQAQVAHASPGGPMQA